MYQHRVQRESKHTHQNLGSHFISQITPIVSHHLQYQGQHNRQGLGTGRYVKPDTFAKQRKLFTHTLRDIQNERPVAHSHTLVLQGVCTHWIGSVPPFDFTWKNRLYNVRPKLLTFVINTMINSLPTPDMLRLWLMSSDASCYLCRRSPCT